MGGQWKSFKHKICYIRMNFCGQSRREIQVKEETLCLLKNSPFKMDGAEYYITMILRLCWIYLKTNPTPIIQISYWYCVKTM